MNELTELEVEEVSLVDAGANPRADILLFKRKGETKMAEKETKAIEQSATEIPASVIDKAAEQPAPVDKHDEQPKVDEIDKAASLEQERAELAKAQATVDALIGKLQEHVDKADTAELTAVAKKYEILGFKSEELVPQLKSLKQFPELYGQLIQTLDTSLAAVQKAKTFEEIGKSGRSEGVVQVEKVAHEIIKQNPKLTWRQALDQAYQMNPDLQGI